ncbi:hypothetical protein AYR66_22495 [Noviherbaspirillum denitrificans]|uniref:Uncharacterized protein n=1 Tax=Noviherbaspirillum denitrificans TaxID=1968433 RepID=A0A254TKL4_9BURK|nr:hypothetical protein AYR66_22495 [Noviherbaspirillum denitrificans]
MTSLQNYHLSRFSVGHYKPAKSYDVQRNNVSRFLPRLSDALREATLGWLAVCKFQLASSSRSTCCRRLLPPSEVNTRLLRLRFKLHESRLTWHVVMQTSQFVLLLVFRTILSDVNWEIFGFASMHGTMRRSFYHQIKDR